MTFWYAGLDGNDKINSPDDGHIAVRNMYRIEINVNEKNCASSWLFRKTPSPF